MRSAVEAGRTRSDDVGVLGKLHQIVRRLYQGTKSRDGQLDRLARVKAVASAAAAIKGLGDLARKEAFRVVRSVDPAVRRYYTQLYGNEVLELEMITPGHAANQTVKTEINAYFKVAGERVPTAPFSNAGRLRGIMLSFVFALLEHSTNSIGLIILDDPALSMDDEHKARFADHLIAPAMANRQVLLATHHSEFFKVAEHHFRDGQRLTFTPRRQQCDAVGFDPQTCCSVSKRPLTGKRPNGARSV
jgi:hypothetical protein